jgi:hypothetical protein
VSVRKHTLGDFNEGRVCLSCNTGWMSRLETGVQPILTSLIHADREVAHLTRRERDTLGHWAMKTAFVLNSASGVR